MALVARNDLRNVAIVAHVDHGKTTLVDAMLKQTNSFDAHFEGEDRMMDSNDLEREKGITILAKNTAVLYNGKHADGSPIVINVIDTPGHADFGGEVERGLSMVDGVVLLVDASEGPLPQTRFVLRKALEAKLPVILLVNKTDRPDARIDEVVAESQDLLLGLASDMSDEHPDLDLDAILDVPVVYASGRNGAASANKPENGTLPDNDDLEPLFKAILDHVPAPTYDDQHPLQAHVTNLDASPFLGRLALLRVFNGTLKKGQQVAWVKHDGSVKNVKITELLITKALDRFPTESAGPGDIVAVAGIEDITIGETLADPDDVRPLPTITVDDPAISMTIGTNTSPLIGKVKGHKLTARMVKDRLDRELIGNVSIKLVDIGRPDAWEIQGRGELALAILVEQMRREGFELTVGKPQVVVKQVDGKVHEPFEHLTIDSPEEYLGAITQLLAARKGRMEGMANHGTGWVRMEFVVPSRGLIGFRTEFLTITRGAGIANAVSHGYEQWAGEITTRVNGSIVADRAGVATPFAMVALQERMSFFVEPTQEVYEGMVVGENSRADDMDVNITKEKQLTNMRQSTSDSFERMTPSRRLTLEECLEFAREDECVEVTPEFVRIRKVELDANARQRKTSRLKKQNA
ncbi:translational GTPase TypA [Clavibacter michiganensis]|uniref:Large ribosomal subunit assembly factor BipA n=4 Tax=Clavibacter michiganensis TaxID=28447 RepID=W8SML6_CLAMM|nr:translational GTPase TypA [Clavibacter michiganensis]AHM10156.1 GTP-binding protein [Clavibacter michiganensis subsp. michiganensis]AJW79447.1 GTP-binding protein TypA [Clavibacter michiganensis subsp. insidiosus]AWF97808.1 GTP-binding protein [Clavibacter michiganensis subsp. insidiosus]AWG01992.1 GTP-binding protein [Clavibacter michiganensis subsp. insidiosus]KAF0258882.1 GTP-binding protein TypA/BipA [Clavibacter michiganensis subsp. michiganensis]